MSRAQDDALLMALATPSNPDEAARLLTHPIEQALQFSDARAARMSNTGHADAEFWRRLAGSLRKARTMI